MAEIIHKLSFDFSEFKSSNTVFIDASSTEDILEVSFYNAGKPFDLTMDNSTQFTAELIIDSQNSRSINSYYKEKNVVRFRMRSLRDDPFKKEWSMCEIRLSCLTGGGVYNSLATQNFMVHVDSFSANIEYDKNGSYLTKDDIDKIKNHETYRLTEMINPINFPDKTIVQYVGESTSEYITGYFYQTEHISNTYAIWKQVFVQPIQTMDGKDLLDHNILANRSANNQHPITAISYLVDTLNYFANSELSDEDIDKIISDVETMVSEVNEI